jgi:hypothetical protein
VVHAVQQRVGPGREEAAALADVGESEEEPLPEFIHRKHLVRRVAVQVKCLREQGQVVMGNEKYENGHRSCNGKLTAQAKSLG